MRLGTVRLEGEHVILRRYMKEDAAFLYEELGCNPAITKYTGWNPYVSLEKTEEIVEDVMTSYDTAEDYSWVIEVDGAFAGAIGAYDYCREEQSIEIGYSIAQGYWGRGIASEAVHLAAKHLLGEDRIKRVTAWTHPENSASGRVLSKNGFVKQEKEGGRLDWEYYG